MERVLGGIVAVVGTDVSAPNSSELELSSLVWIQEKEPRFPLAKAIPKQAKGFIWPCL